jgi:hypothetical protein
MVILDILDPLVILVQLVRPDRLVKQQILVLLVNKEIQDPKVTLAPRV